MCFWSWGRELEDTFDDANTQKLSRVIVKSSQSRSVEHVLPSSPKTGHSSEEIELSTILGGQYDEPASGHQSENQVESDLYLKRSDGELLKLERIPVMAVFHRNDAAGKGVPHSFASFLQRYPALPQVVVCHLIDLGHMNSALTAPSDFLIHASCRRSSCSPRRPLYSLQSPFRPRLLRGYHEVSQRVHRA